MKVLRRIAAKMVGLDYGSAAIGVEAKVVEKIEKKSFNLTGFIDFLDGTLQSDLTAYASISLFNQVSTLANSVDILAAEVSSLVPIIKNDTDEIIDKHPVLDLLKNPNADSTTAEFLYSISALFEITGNAYMEATGPVNRPPVEIWPVYPQTVMIYPDTNDGYAGIINKQTEYGSLDFKRYESGKRWRFYHGDDVEIWQIKAFNPFNNSLFGQSPATPIFPELEQFRFSSIHNAMLLKRGGRPSGILMAKDRAGKDGDIIPGLTNEQFTRLREQTTRYIESPANTGRILLASGGDMEWKDLITSNRDMDFAELKRDVSNRIYNQYKIPLPFVNPERQTFANMAVTREQLYDNAVLPLADRIFNELNNFLMPRYPRSENLRLAYDEAIIPALKARKIREATELRKTGVLTDNEIRAILGYEPYEGGDNIYKPASEVPVGEDSFTDDQPTKPTATRKEFFEAMKARGYSEEKIKRIAANLEFRVA